MENRDFLWKNLLKVWKTPLCGKRRIGWKTLFCVEISTVDTFTKNKIVIEFSRQKSIFFNSL